MQGEAFGFPRGAQHAGHGRMGVQRTSVDNTQHNTCKHAARHATCSTACNMQYNMQYNMQHGMQHAARHATCNTTCNTACNMQHDMHYNMQPLDDRAAWNITAARAAHQRSPMSSANSSVAVDPDRARPWDVPGSHVRRQAAACCSGLHRSAARCGAVPLAAVAWGPCHPDDFASHLEAAGMEAEQVLPADADRPVPTAARPLA
jgi:hypothetical protein